MAARVEFRELGSEEGNRLLRIVRRGTGSVVTWRRAQIVLLSAQGMSPRRISEVVFTDPDRVREVIHNFNRDSFDFLYPRYRGGRPQTFTLPQRREITKIALSVPTDVGQPFATWSLAKLADYLVAEGVVADISHEGLRQLLREEGVRFQALRTWKRSNDPDFEREKNRASSTRWAGEAVVICLDEFGPLNLQPHPGGKAWAPRGRPRRIRATYTCPSGIRHLLSAYDVGRDRLYGHMKKRKSLRFLAQPDRAPVQGAALLPHQRHRPSRPRYPGTSDPPLHRLAQRPHREPEARQHRPPRKHGNRWLTIH